MKSRRPEIKTFWLFVMILAIGSIAPASSRAQYTPQHPDVQRMVNSGIGYLEATAADANLMPEASSSSFGGGTGTHILVAYAHYKCRHDPNAPLVKKGVSLSLSMVDVLEKGGGDSRGSKRNYEVPMAILLLAEVDPKRYKSQLTTLQGHLFKAQKSNGGWSYPEEKKGDISQTQYVLLATWTLDKHGIPLDYNRVLNCIQWIMRVQDPQGGWPYHGDDPGIGRPLKQQQKIDMSMTLAGGSSLLIAGDSLGVWGDTKSDDSDPGIVGLPKAIRLYIENANTQRRRRVNVSPAPIWRSIGMMDVWRQKNPYKRTNIKDWYYYQLYTLERYESFVEISKGRVKDKSPRWYNEGVEQLKRAQSAEGGWIDASKSIGPVNTSFALLFLIRSTQKAAFNMGEGALSGGYGLPDDTTNIRVEGSQIKGEKLSENITDMLNILEKDAGGMEGKSIPEDLQLDKDPVARRAQLDRLERLVRGSKSWQARRVAARLLGTSDEMRVVPALIFALSDPDPQVWRYARDGLRFISRKFDGMGLDDSAFGNDAPNVGEVAAVQKKWRAWFKSMNPRYVFLDYDL